MGAQPVMIQPGMQTTVVVTQQQVRDWYSGMFGCFEEMSSCVCGWLCPCILLIQISQRMGEGCLFPRCCQGAALALRVKIRADNGIQGTMCNDAVTLACCGACALCQMARELSHV